MHSGGVAVSERTASTIRLVGLFLPLILIADSLLRGTVLSAGSPYTTDTSFLLVIIPWLLSSVISYAIPARSSASIAMRLAVQHLFVGLFIVTLTGFSVITASAWVALLLSAFIYFRYRGLYSNAGLLIIVAIGSALQHPSEQGLALHTLSTVIAILLIGLLTAVVSHNQEVDGSELVRSKAEESLQRDRILTIVNNLADAVLSTDKDGIIRVYNAASLNLLDTNNSLNGHHINEVITAYDQDDHPIDLFTELRKSRGAVVRDDLSLHLEGEKLRLEVTFSPIRGNFNRTSQGESRDGYILILRDITKTKSLEEERDEFISVVSHELRTPITIAEGTISNVQLMMGRPDIAPPTLKQGIDTAHDQVLFLAKMVNDLSTLSRAERGVADAAEAIDVRELVNDLYNEYAPQAEKKSLHFNLDMSPQLGQVFASRLYLKELLQNFVTNAIKYTKEGSITLHINLDGDTIHFGVQDTGIGISKSDQAKVFNKFYRSEDYRTRETGGTGLGLYVAVKLAKKLGTTIDLTSRLNHGSTFSFSLPLSK